MKTIATIILSASVLLVSSCIRQQIQQQQVHRSNVVVLDIGHYYEPTRGGQGARTPDARYGSIEECEFWYRYAGYVKQTIEAAGYHCIICNRGSLPTDPELAAAAKRREWYRLTHRNRLQYTDLSTTRTAWLLVFLVLTMRLTNNLEP